MVERTVVARVMPVRLRPRTPNLERNTMSKVVNLDEKREPVLDKEIETIEFDSNILMKLLTDRNKWMRRCRLVRKQKDSRLNVYCPEHDCYLRHSKGPFQGYMWDVYGDDFLYEELALYALSQAPTPSRPYVKFTLNISNTG